LIPVIFLLVCFYNVEKDVDGRREEMEKGRRKTWPNGYTMKDANAPYNIKRASNR
jgi:hypothetical protein